MDEIDLNEALLNNALEREPISEKQSKKQRQKKHEEWRDKNPGKVRKQVADYEQKSRNGGGPQAGKAARRDEERNLRNQGKKSNSKCANCGSTTNVQADHQKGYAKGAPTKPLCHKCHTERPQQNQKGDRSVKGGTVSASYDRQQIPLLEADPGWVESQATKSGEGPATLPKRHKQHKRSKIKERFKKSKEEGPSGAMMYPHLDNPRILVKYLDPVVINDFGIANSVYYNPEDDLFTIQVTEQYVESDSERNKRIKAVEAGEEEVDETWAPAKTQEESDLEMDRWSDADIRKPIEKTEQTQTERPSYAGMRLNGKVMGGRITATEPSSEPGGLIGARGVKEEEEEERTPGGFLRFKIVGRQRETIIPYKYLIKWPNGHYTRPHGVGDRNAGADEDYLEQVSWKLEEHGSSGKHMESLMPLPEVISSSEEITADRFGPFAESALEYQKRIKPIYFNSKLLYDGKSGKGGWLALEKDRNGTWRFLNDPSNNIPRIRMVVPVDMHQPFDVFDYNQGEDEESSGPYPSEQDGSEDPETLQGLLDPDDLDVLVGDNGVPEEPIEFDKGGVRHDLTRLSAKSKENYENQGPSNKELEAKFMSGRPGGSLRAGATAGSMPTEAWWRELFAEQFLETDSDESLEILISRLPTDKQKILQQQALSKVVEDIAIFNVGVDRWRNWNEVLTRGLAYKDRIEEIDKELEEIKDRNPTEYHQNPKYQELLADRKLLDDCPKCRGKKTLDDGTDCDACSGTGEKAGILGDDEKEKLEGLKKMKIKALSQARRQFNSKIHADKLKHAKLDLFSNRRLKAAIGVLTTRGQECEVCRGLGFIPIDRDKELKDLKDAMRKRQKRTPLELDKKQRELDLKRKDLDKMIERSTDQESINILKAKVERLKSNLKDSTIRNDQELRRLGRREKGIENGDRTKDKCYACSGTGEPRVRSETPIRGGEDLTIEAETKKLGDAIKGRYAGECSECKGKGISDTKEVRLRIDNGKQAKIIIKLLNKLLRDGHISNEKWIHSASAASHAKTRLPSAEDISKKEDIPLEDAQNKAWAIADRYVELYKMAAERFIRLKRKKKSLIQKRMIELNKIERDVQLAKKYQSSNEIPDGRWGNIPEFSSTIMNLEIANAYQSKSELLVDDDMPADLADELVAYLTHETPGSAQIFRTSSPIKAQAIPRKCEKCKGSGRLDSQIADGVRGMWAQSFNSIVKDSLPRHGEFLKEIIDATDKYEENLDTITGVFPNKDYAVIRPFLTDTAKKAEAEYGIDSGELDDDDDDVEGLWGFRKNDRHRYLNISDLVLKVNGELDEKCPECHHGIQTKKLPSKADKAQGQLDDDGNVIDWEKYLYPSSRKHKLTKLQNHLVTDEGKIIQIDNEIYSRCQLCSGMGRIEDSGEPRDLKKDPIYVERREDPYQHYQTQYSNILSRLPGLKSAGLEARYSEPEEELRKSPEAYIKLRHPALYRLLIGKGSAERQAEVRQFIDSYDKSPQELEAEIEKKFMKSSRHPEALKNQGIFQIVDIVSTAIQGYGGDLKMRALELVKQDDRGDWDNLYVSPDEVEELLDKHGGGYALGKSWDSLNATQKIDWRDRVRRIKKDEYLALAKARDIAATAKLWNRDDLDLVERRWGELSKGAQNAYINSAKAGTLTIGDDEVKPGQGTITITFVDLESGEKEKRTYRTEFNPTLLEVFPISKLRAQDKKRSTKFRVDEPRRKQQAPRRRRMQPDVRRPQGRGQRGKRGKGRRHPKFPGFGKKEAVDRSNMTSILESIEKPEDSVDRSNMTSILESIDRDFTGNSIDPEDIAKLL